MVHSSPTRRASSPPRSTRPAAMNVVSTSCLGMRITPNGRRKLNQACSLAAILIKSARSVWTHRAAGSHLPIRDAGNAFVERFTVDAYAEYPDDGATVECWTTGKGIVGNLNFEDSKIYHMETEVLSPLHTFEPGARHSFQIEWGACTLPGRVMDVQAGGCTAEALRVRKATDEGRVQGSLASLTMPRSTLVGKDSSRR